MTKTTKHQDTEAERLERCRQIMELRENGLWEQIHGVVLPQYQTQDTNEKRKMLKNVLSNCTINNKK